MDVDVLVHGLVIIGDFHSVGIGAVPTEAHPILVVDPDTVLAGAIAFERLQPIAWRYAQFLKR
jgi:hypothetical protein